MASFSHKYFLFIFLLVLHTNISSEIEDEIVVTGDWREIKKSDKDSSLKIFDQTYLNKNQVKHFESSRSIWNKEISKLVFRT